MKRDNGSAAQVGDSIRIEGGIIHFDPPCVAPVPAAWETIASNPTTQRLAVPGGWLYFVELLHHEPTMCFVPDPTGTNRLFGATILANGDAT